MDTEIWLTIIGLAITSFIIRLTGYILASRLPEGGLWTKGLDALPGSIMVALVSLMMINGNVYEWMAGAVVLGTVALTGNVASAVLLGVCALATMRFLTV